MRCKIPPRSSSLACFPQVQFKVVYALVLWCMVATAWGLMRAAPGQPMYWLALAVFIHSPLAMAPVLDALEAQSRTFRLGVPSLFIVYVSSQAFYYGYVLNPTLLVNTDRQQSFPGANADDGGAGRSQAAINSDAYQVSSALTTIALLMARFLFNVLRDPTSGGAVCWPLEATITVQREDAERVSFTGLGFLKVSATSMGGAELGTNAGAGCVANSCSFGSGGTGIGSEAAVLRARVAALETELENLRSGSHGSMHIAPKVV